MPDAVITDDNGLDNIQCRVLLLQSVATSQRPETITAPHIDWPMITGLKDTIEDVVVFDDMPTPGTIIDVKAGTWTAVNRFVRDNHMLAHRDIDASRLLLEAPHVVHVIVTDGDITWIIIGFGARRGISQRRDLVRPCRMIAYSRTGTNYLHISCAIVRELILRDQIIAVITIN